MKRRSLFRRFCTGVATFFAPVPITPTPICGEFIGNANDYCGPVYFIDYVKGPPRATKGMTLAQMEIEGWYGIYSVLKVS